jgi:hypothetical protein
MLTHKFVKNHGTAENSATTIDRENKHKFGILSNEEIF